MKSGLLCGDDAILFDEKRAAAALGISLSTIRRQRWLGLGPKTIKIGSLVRYPKSELEAWVLSQVSGQSEGGAASAQ
jgi:predicted DNA-binding transcriptional regulator AlpA